MLIRLSINNVLVQFNNLVQNHIKINHFKNGEESQRFHFNPRIMHYYSFYKFGFAIPPFSPTSHMFTWLYYPREG